MEKDIIDELRSEIELLKKQQYEMTIRMQQIIDQHQSDKDGMGKLMDVTGKLISNLEQQLDNTSSEMKVGYNHLEGRVASLGNRFNNHAHPYHFVTDYGFQVDCTSKGPNN